MARVGESTIRRTKLVEERVHHGLDGRETLCRGVLEKGRNQLNRIWSCFTEDLATDQYNGFRSKRKNSLGQYV